MSFDRFLTAAGMGIEAFRRALATPPEEATSSRPLDEAMSSQPLDERLARRASEYAQRATSTVERKIHAEPGRALLLAAGVGFIAGVYLSRRSARARALNRAAAREHRNGDHRACDRRACDEDIAR